MISTTLNNKQQESVSSRPLTIFAYVILLFSLPVYGFWRAFMPVSPARLVWIQALILLAILLVTQFWQPLRPLRGLAFIALMVTIITSLLVPFAVNSALWTDWFGADNPTFWQANSGSLFLKLVSTLLIIGILLLMGLKRPDFFLVKGQLDAPVAPVPWLGMKKPVPWTKVGRNFAVLTFIIILSFVLLPNLSRLNMSNLAQALPLMPAALLFAAVNSIYEEVVFRASFLSQLVNVVGNKHALVFTIIFFGLGHLTGSVPSGIIGVLLSAFFALVMGKAMLETRGMTWPWICHFAADAAVFMSLAILFV